MGNASFSDFNDLDKRAAQYGKKHRSTRKM